MQLQPAAQGPFRVQQPGQQKGVGHGGNAVPGGAVAGRTGRSAGALGADLQGAGLVGPNDGAAAGADGGNRHRGNQNGKAGDLLLGAQHRLAAPHHAEVGAGAADVQGHQVGGVPAGLQGCGGSAGHPSRRAGQQRRHRPLRQSGEPLHAAVGAGAPGRGAQAALRHALRQQFDLALHRRTYVGVDDGQGGAFKLPGLRPDFAGEIDAQLREPLLDEVPRPPFMGGIPVAVQKADHQGLATEAAQLGGGGQSRGFAQRLDHFAFGVQPLLHLGDQLARNQRLGAPRIVAGRLRNGEAGDFQHVAKAGRDQQAKPRSGAFEQAIERHRVAVGVAQGAPVRFGEAG